jgi:protein-disulfide isomerase
MNEHAKFELAVPVGAVDHALGASHAPVTVVEYGDFECPNCKQAAPAVKLLLERFAGRARLVYRHFPLEEVQFTTRLAPIRPVEGCEGGAKLT